MRDYRDIIIQGKPFVQVIRQHRQFTLDGQRRPLVKVNLSETNLRAFDLSGLMFVDANFEAAELSMANLSGTIITNSYFRRARLVDANLSGAVFELCDFTLASLRGANLGNATFDDVNFCATDLQRVKFLATILENVIYDEYTAWPNDLERFGFNLDKMTTWHRRSS